MKYVPREYQAKCTKLLIDNPRYALFISMGLGKSVITATAMIDLMDRVEVARWLIVAPKRVAEVSWPDEFQKWDHLKGVKVEVLTAAKLQPGKKLPEADVYTVHYDLLPRLVGQWKFDGLVLDESSCVKNPSTKRFKTLKKVLPKVSRVIQLSGTPAPNGIEDLWSQIYLLDKGQRLGRTMTHFRSIFMTPGQRNGPVVYKWLERDGARDDVMSRVSDLCMSLKSEDWVTLPDRIMNNIPVRLPTKAENAYRQLERDYLLPLKGEVIEAATAAALIGKLLQAANGALYDEEHNWHHLHDAKLDALEELSETCGNLLVAYTYQHDKERLLGRFPQARELSTAQDIRDWNAGKIKMLICHPRSAGHGLNLQDGGSECVWFGPTYDLEIYQQFNKRLHRSGQSADRVVIHHLIAQGTIDPLVLDVLEGKASLQEAILNAVERS